MWPAIIGAALQLAGTVAGGIMTSNAEKKKQEMLRKQQEDNENRFNRLYYQDATQRADVQRLLARQAEEFRKSNKAAEGVAAVMGGTDEGVAAQKAVNSAAMANTISGIAAANEARKDAIEQNYNKTKVNLEDKVIAANEQQAKILADTIKGASGIVGNAVTNIGSAAGAAKSRANNVVSGGAAQDGGYDAVKNVDSLSSVFNNDNYYA